MSTEQAQSFIEELEENESLQDEMRSLIQGGNNNGLEAEKILQKIIDFASDHGYEFTAEDYKSAVNNRQEQEGELSDADLEQVAGGGWFNAAADSVEDLVNLRGCTW